MANVNWNTDCAEKVYKLTGKYPAMNCYDFIHICYSASNSWIPSRVSDNGRSGYQGGLEE